MVQRHQGLVRCGNCARSKGLAAMQRMVRAMTVGVLGIATAAAGAQTTALSSLKDPLHIWIGNPDAAKARVWAEAQLAAAQASIDTLLAVKGPRTVENTLVPFDDAQLELAPAAHGGSL